MTKGNAQIMLRTTRSSMLIMLVVASLLLVACASSVDQTLPTAQPQTSSAAEHPKQTSSFGEQPTVVFGQARLRIVNSSTVDLEQLIVRFPNTPISFGAVPAGATTDYQAVPGGVYGYAAYEAVIDGQTIGQGVDDWLGERPLEGTAFTYVLSVDPEQPLVPIQSEVRRDE